MYFLLPNLTIAATEKDITNNLTMKMLLRASQAPILTSRITARLFRALPATASSLPFSVSVSPLRLRSVRSVPQPPSPTPICLRFLHTSPPVRKDLASDAGDPATAAAELGIGHVTDPTPLSEEAYRAYSEAYLNRLLTAVEDTAEAGRDIEGEYSVRSIRFIVNESAW